MTPAEAHAALEDAEVVPALETGLAVAKEVLADCLANGVPATLGSDDHCTKGCAPKAFVLVRSDDIERVQALLARRWQAMVESVGEREVPSVGIGIEVGEDAEPPCPACGTVAQLVEGACAECGLQLG